MRASGLGDGDAQEMFQDGALAALLAGFELDLAAQDVDGGLEVDGSRHPDFFVLTRRTVQRGRGDRLGACNGETR